jgi:release factor glutamine methyltransferase
MTGATVGALLAAAATRLADAGVDSARLDARLLMAAALDVDQGWLIGHRDDALDAARADAFEALVARRAAREPLAHIVGEREFWSLAFKVTPATLIPRPETETLVETVLARIDEQADDLRILDLGTGSGCLLLAILSECPNARGIGIDLSEAALEVACENAARLGLAARAEFRCGHWFEALDGNSGFDVIVTNPPYVTTAEMAGLQPEIADFEPWSALEAGADGLDAYRDIFAGVARQLRPGGVFAGEIGHAQGEAAADLARRSGLTAVAVIADLAGRARCITGTSASLGGATGK